jgi:hypothetical protein
MEDITQQVQLSISKDSRLHLETSRKWSLFLSIMGFIGSGFMILFGLFFGVLGGALMQGSPLGLFFSSFLIMIVYIACGIFYFFPSLFLYQFSNKMKMALGSNSDLLLTDAFKNLRSFFTFFGVLTIIGIALGLLLIGGSIIMGIVGSMGAESPY